LPPGGTYHYTRRFRTNDAVKHAGAISTAVLIAMAWMVSFALAQEPGAGSTTSPTREIGRTTERELSVVLTSSFGSVAILPGQPEKILALQNLKGDPSYTCTVDYTIRNRVGYLDLTLGEPEGRDESGEEKGSSVAFQQGPWELQFSPEIPLSLDVKLGIGKGEFRLGGLPVKDFTLSTGASDVELSFDSPNDETIESINIESGFSRFRAHNLGNANFKRLRFQGGVGSCLLDFNGDLTSEVDVDLQVGFGVVTIIIPAAVGAQIVYDETWMSSIDLDPDFHTAGDNIYTTSNLGTAAGRMNLRVNSGVGSVKVRRQ
jgi:hypothetical protein